MQFPAKLSSPESSKTTSQLPHDWKYFFSVWILASLVKIRCDTLELAQHQSQHMNLLFGKESDEKLNFCTMNNVKA